MKFFYLFFLIVWTLLVPCTKYCEATLSVDVKNIIARITSSVVDGSVGNVRESYSQITTPANNDRLFSTDVALSPVEMYFPLDNHTVYYQGNIQGRTYRANYDYIWASLCDSSGCNFGTEYCFEKDSLDGSQTAYGYSGDKLLMYGATLDGILYGLDFPLTILNDSILTNGGTLQSSSTLTVDGYLVRINATVTSRLIGSETTSLGTVDDCRSIEMSISINIAGVSETVTIKDAWILAPNIGKLKIGVMDQFLNPAGWLTIVGGAVNGQEVDDIINQFIEIEPSITSLSLTPDSGTVPLLVTITCNASDPDGGSIVEYRWDFDNDGTVDDTTAIGLVVHNFVTTGNNSISCTVVDDEGMTANALVYLTIDEETQYIKGEYNYCLPYYSSVNNNWTGLGLGNCNQGYPAQLQVTVYDSNGNLLATENKIIPAHGQDAFPIAASVNQSGWMRVNSHEPLSGLAFIGLSGAVPLMADIPFIEKLSPSLVIPHIAQDEIWDTSILICNPQDQVNNITLQLINQDGALQGEELVTIATLGSGDYPLSSLFDQASQKSGKVKINASSGIAAFALYKNIKSGGSYCAGINAVLEGVSTEETYNYYLPYYSSRDGDWTGLGLSNSNGDVPSSLLVTVFNNEGDIQDSVQPEPSVPADGQIAVSVKSELVDTGWIQVVSQQPLTGLAFIGTGGATPLMADIPFIEELSENLVVPHVAQDLTWDTTILLCNPNDEDATVNLENIDQAGEMKGTSQHIIKAHGSGQYLLSTLFAEHVSIAGKINITSSTGLAGFALYSNKKSGGYYFAGINAEGVE